MDLMKQQHENFEKVANSSKQLSILLADTLEYMIDLTTTLEGIALATKSKLTSQMINEMKSKIHNFINEQITKVEQVNAELGS